MPPAAAAIATPPGARATRGHSATAAAAAATTKRPLAHQPLFPSSSPAADFQHGVQHGRTPSLYALESDTVTGPLHHSLRGSRFVLAPQTTSPSILAAAAGVAAPAAAADPDHDPRPHVSNPNNRIGASEAHQTFVHSAIRAPKEWEGGSRQHIMQSSMKKDFTTKEARAARQIPVAGSGDNLSRAAIASAAWLPTPADVALGLTPLQALSASRAQDLLVSALQLQARAQASQAAADRLFEASAKERYEVAKSAQQQRRGGAGGDTAIEAGFSPFVLGPTAAASRPTPQPRQGGAQTQRERRNQVGGKSLAAASNPRPSSASSSRTSSSSSSASASASSSFVSTSITATPLTAASIVAASSQPQAGLSTRQRHVSRDWASDPTLHLLARGRAREADEFAQTRSRILGDALPTTSATSDAAAAPSMTSTTREALETGRRVPKDAHQQFVPHFLSKVHPSLHSNLRRNIFLNGNQFVDGVMESSIFKTARFQPRVSGSEEKTEESKQNHTVSKGVRASSSV